MKIYLITQYILIKRTSKSTEEFINKITKGDALRNDVGYIHLRINKYFRQNEITEEKLDMIERATRINLDKYRKQLNKFN